MGMVSHQQSTALLVTRTVRAFAPDLERASVISCADMDSASPGLTIAKLVTPIVTARARQVEPESVTSFVIQDFHWTPT
jgi:hypothetical protein